MPNNPLDQPHASTGGFGTIKLGSGFTQNADGSVSATGVGGSVTSVSVTTANGVSGSVANATTTPAITLTLGAITPSSVAATGAVTGTNLSGTNTGDQDLSTLAVKANNLSDLTNAATAFSNIKQAATTGATGVVELATDGEVAASVVVQGNDSRLSNARTPSLHASSHQNLGADEIDVTGLSGLLADDQNPVAHAADHKSGGTDSIKLDELAAPTDVVTLNASTSAHGLLKKLSNVSTEFMNGQGDWATPSGGISQGKALAQAKGWAMP